MTDVLERLAGPALLSNAAATVYTVPGSTKTTVRNVHVANTSSSSATFTLSIGADGSGTRLFSAVSIPAHSVMQMACGIVLDDGEILQAYSGTDSVLTLTVSGVETT